MKLERFDKKLRSLCCAVFLVYGASAYGQTPAPHYPKMAPVEQYLMERDSEVELARSAAPDSISRDADVFVMGRHGYESAVSGTNGFICLVMRSWIAGADDPDFWNPKLRAPICFNAPASRSYWPIVLQKTQWILNGLSKQEMFDHIKASFDKKELPTMEQGAMCYMMSPRAYLGDAVGRWHPHVMMFLPQTPDAAWGAGLKGSPIFVGQDPDDHLTVFLIPVGNWSDGTVDGAK